MSQAWVTKLALWYISDMNRLIIQNLSQNWVKFKKIWGKNWVSLVKIWTIGILNGSLFLGNLVYV